MNVVQVTENFTAENAGVTTAVAEIAKSQVIGGGGSQTVVACGDRAIAAPPGVKVMLCPTSGLGGAWRYSPSLGQVLGGVLDGVDVAHIHGVWMYTQLCGLNLAGKKRIPSVVTPHNMLGGWLWANAPRINRLKKELYWRFVCGSSFRGAAVVHALSAAERESLHRFFPGTRIEVIPNSIDVAAVIEHAKEDAGAMALPDQYMLFLGRLHPVKGLHLVLQAMAGIPAERRLPLLVVGPQEDPAYFAGLMRLVQEHDLGRDVRFLGGVFGKEKYYLLKRALCLVAPSYSEGISMAALEAMACSVPVLTTAEAGIDQIAQGGGRLVRTDAASVREALVEVSSWQPERLDRGRAALDFVTASFGRDVVGKRFSELYESVRRTA